MAEGPVMRTKRGLRMAVSVRYSIMRVLTDPKLEGQSQVSLAKMAGVSVRTLRDYSTPEFLAEVQARRVEQITEEDLRAVDRAMLEKARAGSVQAARLVYERAGAVAAPEAPEMSLEEMEAMLAELKK